MQETPIFRPIYVTDEMLQYFDEIYMDGSNYRFGNLRYTHDHFGLSDDLIAKALDYWRQTFDKRHNA